MLSHVAAHACISPGCMHSAILLWQSACVLSAKRAIPAILGLFLAGQAPTALPVGRGRALAMIGAVIYVPLMLQCVSVINAIFGHFWQNRNFECV